ncbi:hypothetical protein Tco_0648128 [Tanacetum coccineum]
MLELHDLPHQVNQTVNEVVKEAVQTALQAPLHERFRDLSEAKMKEILHQRMFESGTYQSQPEHVAIYEALKAFMDRDNRDELLEATAKSRKRRRDDQDPPPPPPDSDQSKKKRHDSDASGSKQAPAPQSSVWKTSDTREAPSSSFKQKLVPHSEQPIEEVPIPDVNISDSSEDTDTAHLPKIKTRPDWLKSIPEEDRLETLEPDWVIPPNDLPEPENNWANAFIEKSKLSKADLEGPAYKGNRLVPDVGKPLPLGGPPGQVTIQPQFFFNKDMEYLVSCNQERRNDLSISMLKAAYYPDFGLEEFEFYITRHSAPSDHGVVRSHMQILSVVSLKTYERYGYTFLKEIVLRRVNYNEYKISEADFKNLHPNDFEDLYLLHLQGKLNHLSGADKVHLFNDASDFLFKEDYTIVSKPRAVIYRDSNDQKKMMRETEVHKFSDSTLTRILEKLDHMVKYFKLSRYNPGMERRIWLVRLGISSHDPARTGGIYPGTIVSTEMELVLEQTQEGSYKDGDIDGDTMFQQSQVHNRMLILDQHLCRNHESSSKGFNASVNSDINFFLGMLNTQDGEGSQDDDQRLRLADDLKKAQDHIQ